MTQFVQFNIGPQVDLDNSACDPGVHVTLESITQMCYLVKLQ